MEAWLCGSGIIGNPCTIGAALSKITKCPLCSKNEFFDRRKQTCLDKEYKRKIFEFDQCRRFMSNN